MAAKAYWLTKALAEREHDIHVITDAVRAENIYQCRSPHGENRRESRVQVHRAAAEVPWIIPQDRHPALGLLDKTLEVIKTVGADLLCSAYLVPYGLVGCFASSQSNIPLVLQHGGSEIHKFLLAGVWEHLWTGYLGQARTIVSDVEHSRHLSSRSLPVAVLTPYVPDPSVFFSSAKRRTDRPRLALIGKANFHWRHKGWHRAIEIWKALKDRCDFLIVSQGLGIDGFRTFASHRLGDEVEWRTFVHPADMPDLLRSVDYLFSFEMDLPHRVFSNLNIEALYCGVKIVTDTPDIIDRYRMFGLDVSNWEDLFLSVPYDDTDKAAELLLRDLFLSKPIHRANSKDYTGYIHGIEAVLIDALGS